MRVRCPEAIQDDLSKDRDLTPRIAHHRIPCCPFRQDTDCRSTQHERLALRKTLATHPLLRTPPVPSARPTPPLAPYEALSPSPAPPPPCPRHPTGFKRSWDLSTLLPRGLHATLDHQCGCWLPKRRCKALSMSSADSSSVPASAGRGGVGAAKVSGGPGERREVCLDTAARGCGWEAFISGSVTPRIRVPHVIARTCLSRCPLRDRGSSAAFPGTGAAARTMFHRRRAPPRALLRGGHDGAPPCLCGLAHGSRWSVGGSLHGGLLARLLPWRFSSHHAPRRRHADDRRQSGPLRGGLGVQYPLGHCRVGDDTNGSTQAARNVRESPRHPHTLATHAC